MIMPAPMINYKAGKTYTLQVNVKVRNGAGQNSPQKLYEELSAAYKKNAFEQMFAVLKAGTRVVALKVINNNGEVWLKTPVGYLCAKTLKEIYIC